jgi:hypothetical protein
VETGRFRYWGDDGERAGSDGWWFWHQAAGCTYAVAPGAPFARALRWGVPAGVMVESPGGRVPLHDDRLVSAALIAHYDGLLAEGTVRAGAGEAVVVGV